MISRSRKPNPDTSYWWSSQFSSKMLTLLCVYSGALQRQPAFDTFDSSNSLFAGYFFSLNEDQTLQEVPTGFDSTSYGNSSLCSPQCSQQIRNWWGLTNVSWVCFCKCSVDFPKNKWFNTWTSVYVLDFIHVSFSIDSCCFLYWKETGTGMQ